MTYSKTLVDSIGNVHPRKNKYIVDLIEAAPEERKRIASEKAKHPYNIALKAFYQEEKAFLKALNAETAQRDSSASDKHVTALKGRLYKAQKQVEFYEAYRELTYDAEFKYQVAAQERRHIPEIIANHEALTADLADRRERLSKIDESERAKRLKEIEAGTSARKQQMDRELSDLAAKYKDGMISKKALGIERQIRKRACEEDTIALSYRDPKKSLEQSIKSIQHRIKVEQKSAIKVLESDIADIRRKTPIEIDKKRVANAFLSIPVPGLGQLLNGQPVKALFMFLGAIFIYLIAIPYALGYGNYRGEGVAGLISLAQNGARLDKSIIFMIEGIIALILLGLAVFIYLLAFKDAYKVEKALISGVRSRNWFETKQAIATDGFPYVVSSPALLVILFIVLVPIFTTILISFTNMNPDNQSKFTWLGIDNYRMLFMGQGVAGKAFWPIVRWTLIWTIGATTVAIAIGFILSLIAHQERIRFKGFFRTIYLLPWAVPAFITIMFFSQMVAKNGPITELIERVFGIALDIKNNTLQTRISLILLQGWLGSAYIFLLSTGILQGIPSDLYEAAEIDGATGFQKTLRITIPLVLFQTGPLLISQYTFNFNNFSIIHLFNGGGPFDPMVYGNLAGSTDILISYIYKLTINNNYQGIGAAVTIVISLVLMFFAWVGFKNTKAFKEI